MPHLPAFALIVGALRPHKNVARAIEATCATGLELWHVGPTEIEDPDLARQLASNAHVRWLGPRGDAELVDLYRLARVVLLPAYREDFGLPVAEALCVGTAVVASNRSSLPEVVSMFEAQRGEFPGARGRAHLVDPDNAEGWVRAIRQIIGEPRGAPQGARDEVDPSNRRPLNRWPMNQWPSWRWAAAETLGHLMDAATKRE